MNNLVILSELHNTGFGNLRSDLTFYTSNRRNVRVEKKIQIIQPRMLVESEQIPTQKFRTPTKTNLTSIVFIFLYLKFIKTDANLLKINNIYSF